MDKDEVKIIDDDTVWVRRGVIKFDKYEKYLKLANDVAEEVEELEVSEETIKATKRRIAEARKVVNALEDKRKEIKKICNEPYEQFREQVDTITAVIRTADDGIRVKIDDYNEALRDEKEKEIHREWDARMQRCEFSKFYDFDMFLDQRGLNQSVTMKKIFERMAEWIETHNANIRFALTLEHGEEIVAEYLRCGDIGQAGAKVKEHYADLARIEEAKKKAKEQDALIEEPKKEARAMFIITGELDITKAENLLIKNDIKFEKQQLD